MALFGLVKNKVDCSISALGTGVNNCRFNIELINGIYAVKRGNVIDDTADTFDKAFLQSWIQQGIAIPLINAIGMTDDSADDTIQTTASGVELKANDGRYMFTLEYLKGEYFNKALSCLDSWGVYDVILTDENGSFLMTENIAGTSSKGFKTGRFTPNKRKLADGSVGTTKSVTFQLLDRDEFDKRLVWVTSEEAGFSPEEADGINDITASFNVDPANLGTTLIVDFISTADNNTGLAGLVDANILVTIDGVLRATTWVADSIVTGRYTGTLTALATDEVVQVQLWDAIATPPANSIIKGDAQYRSNVLEATVVI